MLPGGRSRWAFLRSEAAVEETLAAAASDLAVGAGVDAGSGRVIADCGAHALFVVEAEEGAQDAASVFFGDGEIAFGVAAVFHGGNLPGLQTGVCGADAEESVVAVGGVGFDEAFGGGFEALDLVVWYVGCCVVVVFAFGVVLYAVFSALGEVFHWEAGDAGGEADFLIEGW